VSVPRSAWNSWSAHGQLASARLGQLGQTQERIVAGDGLKGEVGMPLRLLALALGHVDEAVQIQLLGLLGGDDADLVVLDAELSASIVDGVDVQLRR